MTAFCNTRAPLTKVAAAQTEETLKGVGASFGVADFKAPALMEALGVGEGG